MSQHEDLISRFRDVTGVGEEQARFYLESSLWQLEVALVSFYENEERQEESIEDNEDNEVEEITGSDSLSSPPKVAEDENSTGVGSSKPKSSGNPRFATVSSLTRDQSSDEEEGQAFYAGGSEHSGQQVLGPGKKKKNSFVAEIFKTFQERGAEIVDTSDTLTTRRTATFTGVGYRLGQSSNDTEVVGTSDNNPSSSNRDVNVTLKMWNDGFSINDGPLRKYSDPETTEFLASIDHGEVPEELIKEAKGGEVHLYMEDHSHEEFVQIKPKVKAFSGKGNVLGSPAPQTVVVPTSTSDQDKTCNEDKAKEAVAVNADEPTTTIQIRLADGSRMIATFNQTHTIADLRTYIVTYENIFPISTHRARPEYENTTFNLMTTFPSKELDDNTKTLIDAGILNTAIMQRLT